MPLVCGRDHADRSGRRSDRIGFRGLWTGAITQSISIIAPPGVYGGVSVKAGNGIDINGSAIEVMLRGLSINGIGGINGVDFAQGKKLTVEDCEVSYMVASGIDASASNSTVSIMNSVLRDNFAGFSSTDVVAVLDGVHVSGNFSGAIFKTGSRVTVTGSALMNNSYSGVVAYAALGSTEVMVTRSTIGGSSKGMIVEATAGSMASIVADGIAINGADSAAFLFDGFGGTEIIYSTGTNTVGFPFLIVSGGTLTPIGQH